MSDLKYPEAKDGKVVCQECGEAFRLITPAHLKSNHNMTFAEYKLKYPKCPVSSKEYEASRFTYRDSLLFKNNEADERPVEKEEEVLFDEAGLPAKKTTINLEGVAKNKADILEYLHKAYPYLVDNFSIEKRHFADGRLLYKYITDMADPIKKVLFDFPKSYWHNSDEVPDPLKYKKLKEDGWIVISIDKHYPTVADVKDDVDIISD